MVFAGLISEIIYSNISQTSCRNWDAWVALRAGCLGSSVGWLDEMAAGHDGALGIQYRQAHEGVAGLGFNTLW